MAISSGKVKQNGKKKKKRKKKKKYEEYVLASSDVNCVSISCTILTIMDIV